MVMASFPMPENMSLYVEKATLLMWDKIFKMGTLSYIILMDPVIRILFKEAKEGQSQREIWKSCIIDFEEGKMKS